MTGLYLDVLDRGTDPGGLAYWSGLLQAGTSTRQQVVDGDPRLHRGQGHRGRGVVSDRPRPDRFDRRFEEPTPASRFWAQLLTEGYSDETVESAILASPEYLQGHGASPPTVAAAWYESLTGRAADSGGLTTWSNFLWAGSRRCRWCKPFKSTPEAKATKVARWYSRYLARIAAIWRRSKPTPACWPCASTLVNPLTPATQSRGPPQSSSSRASVCRARPSRGSGPPGPSAPRATPSRRSAPRRGRGSGRPSGSC